MLPVLPMGFSLVLCVYVDESLVLKILIVNAGGSAIFLRAKFGVLDVDEGSDQGKPSVSAPLGRRKNPGAALAGTVGTSANLRPRSRNWPICH